MSSRFAIALILIGTVTLAVFAMTIQVRQGDLRVLLVGAAVSALGIILRRRSARRNKRESGRFSTLRRLRGSREKDLDG